MNDDKVEIIRTTTWSPGPGCHGGCGILAHVKNGKVIKTFEQEKSIIKVKN